MMAKQIDLIQSSAWDILIVLDACRADLFKELYPDFFEGDYQTCISAGWKTGMWTKNTWTQYYDYIYCSANPHIASKVLKGRAEPEWKGYEHFAEVDDIFLSGWSNDLETVPASEVNKAVDRHVGKGKKIVAHYMQPHVPFIGSLAIPTIHRRAQGGKKMIGRGPYTLEEYTINYRYNLIYALTHAQILRLKYPEKNICITADHGEIYGKGHTALCPETIDIPWLQLWSK